MSTVSVKSLYSQLGHSPPSLYTLDEGMTANPKPQNDMSIMSPWHLFLIDSTCKVYELAANQDWQIQCYK